MIKKLLSTILVLMLLPAMPVTAANLVKVPVSCDCSDKKYPLYDEGGTGVIEKDMNGSCFVRVDVTPPDVSRKDPDQLNLMPEGKTNQMMYQFENLGSGYLQVLKSIFSSVDSLYSASFEKPLKEYASTIYIFHTRNYHAFLATEVFGKAFQSLTQYTRADQLANYLADLKKNSRKGQCTADNPEPRCVTEKALCSYEKYTGVLFYKAGFPLEQGIQERQDLDQLLSLLHQRDEALLQEALHSEEALKTALAVYSQFYTTYQLHLQFKEVINALVKVRDVTTALKTLVGCIPNKFIGVASTQCN